MRVYAAPVEWRDREYIAVVVLPVLLYEDHEPSRGHKPIRDHARTPSRNEPIYSDDNANRMQLD